MASRKTKNNTPVAATQNVAKVYPKGYFHPNTESESEAVQRIAFSHGYLWAGTGADFPKVQLTDVAYLYFDSESKKITWSGYAGSGGEGYKQITSLAEAVKFFNLKPEDKIVSLKIGCHVEVFPSGNVAVGDVTLSKESFEDVVDQRNAFLGVKPEPKEKQKLPLVEFEYRNEGSSWWQTRKIAVLKDDCEYIEELDTLDNNKYKKFLKSKIYNQVEFIKFWEGEK